MPPPGSPDARVAAKIEGDIRRRAATKLAVAGRTYEEIADELGYSSRQAAFRDVKRGLAPAAAALREEATHLIAVQLSRLELAASEVMKILGEYRPDGRAEDGTTVYSTAEDQRLAAVDRLVKVSESTRKLLGLDAPTKGAAG